MLALMAMENGVEIQMSVKKTCMTVMKMQFVPTSMVVFPALVLKVTQATEKLASSKRLTLVHQH